MSSHKGATAAVRWPRLYESAEAVGNSSWVAFVRHGEAGHNIDHELLKCPDNPLTENGKAQALAAAEGPAGFAVQMADKVVTTPLTRAVQTTQILLGEERSPSSPSLALAPGTPDASPKRLASHDDTTLAHQTPKRQRIESPSASSAQGPGSSRRVSVSAAATERMSARCDEGTPKSELLKKLPSELQEWEGWDSLEETWWPKKEEDLQKRVQEFREALRKYPEDKLAFVGHGAFWQHVCGKYLKNCEVVFCDRYLGS